MIEMVAEKKKTKKRVPKIKEFKKPVIIGAIIAGVAITGIVGGMIFLKESHRGGTLKIGLSLFISRIDPLETMSDGDFLLVHQVTENLFENIYFDGESQIINNLATGSSWNDNATELTCYLRQNVRFHDGTPFNATAVKWNFDRISRVLNASNIDATWLGYLYFFSDGRWIVNETQVIDPYTIKFILNEPFIPFRSLLTHSVTSILSPLSTPPNKTLNIQIDELVGTGPFKYIATDYIPGNNITLYKNQNYWGQGPYLDEIELLLYYPNNADARGEALWNALLAGEIHMIDENYIFAWPHRSFETLKDNPGIIVQEKPITNYRFIGMYNEKINVTMRKAISYAFNYSKMQEYFPNSVKPATPISDGVLYSNNTFDIPYYNITKARQILIDEGWPGTEALTANDNITASNEWEQLVVNETPLATYNISVWWWHKIQEPISRPLPDNLKQIGVKAIRQGTRNTSYQIEPLGWIYDYNDPHNGMLDYHSKDVNNFFNINDSLIDQWIEEGVKETNAKIRKQKYYDLQERLIEVIFPYVYAFSFLDFDVYTSNLKGWQIYPFKTTVLKTVYF